MAGKCNYCGGSTYYANGDYPAMHKNCVGKSDWARGIRYRHLHSAWKRFKRWVEIGIWYQEVLGLTPEESYWTDKTGLSLWEVRYFLKESK